MSNGKPRGSVLDEVRREWLAVRRVGEVWKSDHEVTCGKTDIPIFLWDLCVVNVVGIDTDDILSSCARQQFVQAGILEPLFSIWIRFVDFRFGKVMFVSFETSSGIGHESALAIGVVIGEKL
eukprot:5164216-Amphidinium_carterae.1